MELFEKGAEAGGDMLSIESTGGKEISDSTVSVDNLNFNTTTIENKNESNKEKHGISFDEEKQIDYERTN